MSWTLHPATEFARHAAAWDALQARVADLPFLESGFLLPLLATFGLGRERLALHHGPQGLDAAALLAPAAQGQWRSFQPSQLPLGAWLSTPGQPLEDLAATLLRALPFPALALGLSQLDSLHHPRQPDRAHWRHQDYIDTAWVDLAGGFDAYWEARGRNLRQNLRKVQHRLEAAGVASRLLCLTRPEDVPAAMAAYGRLEAGGWKGSAGTAIAPEHPQYAFYQAMLSHFCAQGRGRIYQFMLGDQIAAMDLCIQSGRTLVILKTAYDEAHQASSPATLMRQLQFQSLFQEARLDRIEFYGKVMPWHTRWTTQARPLFHATRYRWEWLARMKRRQHAAAPAHTASHEDAPT